MTKEMWEKGKRYCPHCGVDVTNEVETEYGVFCPGCGADFWKSETLTSKDEDKRPLKELRRDNRWKELRP